MIIMLEKLKKETTDEFEYIKDVIKSNKKSLDLRITNVQTTFVTQAKEMIKVGNHEILESIKKQAS